MKRFRDISLLALTSSLISLAPKAVFAQTILIQQGLDNAAKGPYGAAPSPTALPTIIGGFINIAFNLFGILLLLYLLWGGYIWMTAGGDDKKVKDAQAIIRNAIIGTVILVSANFIASFVLSRLGCAVSNVNC